MAHLLEHLLFKGSKNFPKPDVEFSRRGFQNNGTTWLDRTNYFSTFQASDDNLKWAIDWSADAMVNSFIAKKDLDSEMTVVRNEYEMGENDPTRVMLKRMQSVMYDWHNYGNSTIGARSDIENVRIENLQAFYRTYYQPDNAVLTIAGKFDEAKALGLGRAGLRQDPEAQARRCRRCGRSSRRTTASARSPCAARARCRSWWSATALPSALHPDYTAAALAADILGDTPSGPAAPGARGDGQGGAGVRVHDRRARPGLRALRRGGQEGRADRAGAQTLIETIEGGFAQTPATDEELKRQVQQQRTAFERTLADPQAFGVALSEYIALGDWRLFFLSRDQLGADDDGADRRRRPQRYFVRDNRDRRLLPSRGRAAARRDPRRADGRAAAGGLQAGDHRGAWRRRSIPRRTNIDKRTQRLAFGDLKVALLPKQNRGSTVQRADQLPLGRREDPERPHGRRRDGGQHARRAARRR